MIKRKTIFSWLAAVMASAAIGACTGEIVIPDNNAAEAGGDVALVSVSLSNGGYSALQTRSSFTWGESELKDVQLVIVDESTGALVNKYANTSSQIGALSFTGTVGHTYDIWAAANLGGKVTVSELDDFITGNKTVSYSDIASKGIPMYSETSNNTPGPVKITVTGNGDVAVVNMVRMLARVDLKVNKSELDNPSGFAVKGVKIYNAINSYSPFTANVKQAHSGTINYTFDNASSTDVNAINNGDAITLYAFENMQGTLLSGNTDHWKKVPSQISGSADYCTYLELEGSYTNGGETFGKVIYRMYLGNDATTNFDVKRNTKYTVTLYPSEEEIDGHRGSWKIESSDYDDDRSLAFSPRSVTIECLNSGSTSVVKSPSDLAYNFTYSAAEATAAGVTITKTGDSISIVSNEEVTENKTVTLHIETLDGVHEDDCIVTVTPPAIVTTYELELTPAEQNLAENATATVKAMYYTLTNNVRDAGQDVTASAEWSIVSGDAYIEETATKGKYAWQSGAGTATVKATYNGKEDTAVIKTLAHVPVETYTYEVVASATPQSININETTALSATLIEHKFVDSVEDGTGTPVTGVTFTWASRSTSVLTVNGSTGTGVSEGTANVYATCSYGGQTYTSDDVAVTVSNGVDYTIDVWGDISFSLAAGSDAPAKGGETGACTVSNVKQEKWTRTYYYDNTYTDGPKSTVSITDYTVKYGKSASGSFSTTCPTYTGSNLETTVKDRTKIGTIYAYIEAHGETSDTASADVYQQHNILESHVEQSRTPNAKQYGSWTVTGYDYDEKDYWVSIDANRYTSQSSAAPASGGSATLSWSAGHTERTITNSKRSWTQTAKVTYLDTYTSEATANSYDTVDYDSGTETKSDTGDWRSESDTPRISGSATGFSRSGTAVTVNSAGTSNLPNGRSVTYTASNGGAEDEVTLYQEPNVVVETIDSHYEYKDLVLVADPTAFDADGGSSYLDVYAYQRYISQKKVYTSGSYTGGSANSWSTDLHMLFNNYSYAKLTGDSGLSFNLNITDKAVISANTGSARSWNIQATYQDEYSGTLKSNIVTITQEEASTPATVTSVVLVMSPDDIEVGETSTGTVTVYWSDGTHNTVSNSSCTWTTTGTSHGSVNSSGVFTGTSAGTATIKVTYQGVSTTDTVTISSYDIEVD